MTQSKMANEYIYNKLKLGPEGFEPSTDGLPVLFKHFDKALFMSRNIPNGLHQGYIASKPYESRKSVN
jgi:hypothetical protein